MGLPLLPLGAIPSGFSLCLFQTFHVQGIMRDVTVCVLAPFPQPAIVTVVALRMSISCFLPSSTVPLCGQTAFCLSIHPLMSTGLASAAGDYEPYRQEHL